MTNILKHSAEDDWKIKQSDGLVTFPKTENSVCGH